MKEVREQWKPSRFFFGKNKVIAIGLGRTPEEEIEPDLHKVGVIKWWFQVLSWCFCSFLKP